MYMYMCPTYNFLILVGWRHATVVRDAQDVEAVDQALMAGLIQKSRRCATITRGQKLSEEDIATLKRSGAYHDLFSTRECVVREYVKDPDTLVQSVDRWCMLLIEACFHPADASGIRKPIEIAGKTLVASI